MAGRQELLFAASTDPGEVFSVLSDRYTAAVERSSTATWVCLDSSDWRLHRAGLTLRARRVGRRRELVLDSDAGEQLTGPAGNGSWPRRLDAVPSSPLRDRIAAQVGVRALIPRAEVNSNCLPLRLLDEEGKTRVSLRIDQQRLTSAGGAVLPLRVLVSAVRGYERDGHRCVQMLTERLALHDGPGSAVHAALAAAGHVPGGGLVLPTVDAETSMHHCLAELLLHRLDVMSACRDGVLNDTDPEFLHDFRIAIRATRSILRVVGDRLPVDLAGRYGPEFAWLGQATSPIRDLDVWLTMLDGLADVDVSGLDGVEPVRTHLLARRRRELSTLRSALRSPREAELIRAWRASLEKLRVAELPCERTGTFAHRETRRALRRIQRDARAVTAATSADELHDLRKRCKRARYVLEGFWTTYDPDAGSAMQTPVKKLQTCLGDIQDCNVQRSQLLTIASALGREVAPVTTLLAMGALGERLARREREARQDLDRRLGELTSPAMLRAIDSLTGSPT